MSAAETQVIDEGSRRYDIAFSFLQKDEGLVTQLNDLLQDRYSTFVYSKRQEQIAGTDGQETFSKVFGSEARTVVILYRPEWGQTPWTRIEQTAIQNRSLTEGYDFATFIVLSGDELPRWIPRTRIWLSFERFGLKAAAAVIESRIAECGGQVREETLTQRAERLRRYQRLQEAKTNFRRSDAAVRTAVAAYGQLCELLKTQAAKLREAGIACEVRNFYGGLTGVVSGQRLMLAGWQHLYVNDLTDARLSVEFWNGFPKLPNILVFEEGTKVSNSDFSYELLDFDRHGWIAGNSDEYTNESLAEMLLKKFMDHVQRT